MMSEEFAGPNCRRQSVIYPDATQDHGRVVCRTCGAFLCTLAQFRRFVQRRAPGAEADTSRWSACLRLDSNAPRPCLERRFRIFRVGVSSAAPGPLGHKKRPGRSRAGSICIAM